MNIIELQLELADNTKRICALESRPATQMVVYTYPPTLEIDGVLYETLDYVTLVKLVYSLRDRVNELRKRGKDEQFIE